MYGENGTSNSSKVCPERTKQENNVFVDVLDTTTKEKISTEEKNHICFPSMLNDVCDMEEGACGVRNFHPYARSKDFVV
ncbi:hypothetical protein Pfo_013663 [Paulownia fortunei]|nr:hypothetical protein Pfo_013663 [Paulownia fortunei]